MKSAPKSRVWSDIMKSIEILKRICWLTGNVSSIKVWHDPCIPNSHLLIEMVDQEEEGSTRVKEKYTSKKFDVVMVTRIL